MKYKKVWEVVCEVVGSTSEQQLPCGNSQTKKSYENSLLKKLLAREIADPGFFEKRYGEVIKAYCKCQNCYENNATIEDTEGTPLCPECSVKLVAKWKILS